MDHTTQHLRVYLAAGNDQWTSLEHHVIAAVPNRPMSGDSEKPSLLMMKAKQPAALSRPTGLGFKRSFSDLRPLAQRAALRLLSQLQRLCTLSDVVHVSVARSKDANRCGKYNHIQKTSHQQRRIHLMLKFPIVANSDKFRAGAALLLSAQAHLFLLALPI